MLRHSGGKHSCCLSLDNFEASEPGMGIGQTCVQTWLRLLLVCDTEQMTEPLRTCFLISKTGVMPTPLGGHEDQIE